VTRPAVAAFVLTPLPALGCRIVDEPPPRVSVHDGERVRRYRATASGFVCGPWGNSRAARTVLLSS